MTTDITIPYRSDLVVEDWCIENLNDNGRLRMKCTMDLQAGIQTFIFENEIDAMAFKLRWL